MKLKNNKNTYIKRNPRSYFGKKSLIMGCLIVLAVSFTCTFYYAMNLVQIFNSDDAGTPLYVYQHSIYNFPYGLLEKTNLLFFINLICYKIYGLSEKMAQVTFICEYFICCILAAFLSLYDISQKEIKIKVERIPIFLLIALYPYAYGIKYHFPPQFFLLLIGVLIQIFKYYNTPLIKQAFIYMMCIIWSLCNADYLLLVLYCYIPLFIVFIINVYNKYKNNAIWKYIIFFGAILVVLSYFILKNYVYTSYGAYAGLVWPEVETVREHTILFIRSLLNLFTIELPGRQIISFTLFYMIAKLVLVFWAFCIVIRNIYDTCKHKEKDAFEMYLSFSYIFQLIGFIITAFEITLIRYANGIYWISLIIICHQYCKILNKYKELKFKHMNAITFLIIALLITEMFGVYRDISLKPGEEVFELVENEKYKYGMGEFWLSHVNTARTGGKTFIQPVSINNGGYELFMGTLEEYKQGYNYFNYFIMNQDGTGNTENMIRGVYGDPLEIIDAGNTTMYLFDYDVRVVPQKYDCSCLVEENNSILIDNVWLTTGDNRIYVYKTVDMPLNLYVERANGDIQYGQLVESSNEIDIYSIKYIGNDHVNMYIENLVGQAVQIGDVVVKKADNACRIDVQDGTGTIALSDSDEEHYIVSLVGGSVKKCNADFECDSADLKYEKIIGGDNVVIYDVYAQGDNLTVQLRNGTADSCYISSYYESWLGKE